ncbi:hypothetical protein QBC39DRAFT_414603, partial [Podospora conica]
NSIYLLLTAITPFWTAAKEGKSPFPEAREFPLAYGYKTLLLGDDSAAVLDVPTTSYIADLQGKLGANESFHIAADVDAYVARWDPLTASLAANDSLWSQSITESLARGRHGLSTMDLYMGRGSRLGVLPCGNNDRMLIGLYYNSDRSGNMHFHDNTSDPEAARFRRRAQAFSVRRERCHGAWQLNATGIFLRSGSCDSTQTASQDVLHESVNMWPFTYDVLPPLLHMFRTLVTTDSSDADSPWLRPAYAMSVATIYWSRGLYMSQIIVTQGGRRPVTPYDPIGEAMVWSKSTLRADPWLYFVLAVHPAIAVVGLAVVFWLRKVPVGPDFSLVSIMSGLEPGDLALLRGAAFSGELRGAVRLDVITQGPEGEEKGSSSSVSSAGRGSIRYRLREESKVMSKSKQTVLKRGCEYE